MSRVIPAMIVCLLVTLATGCGPKDEVSQEIKKRLRDGWTYEETVGTSRPDAVYIAQITSPTSSKVTAFSCTNDGNRESRIYDQDARQYLIVTMGHEAHGNFSLVFSKPKP